MTITNSTQRFVKESLSSPENQQHQFPVKYFYDPLDGDLEYLSSLALASTIHS
ncbi:hypothetical protein ASPWEDRAFT_166549 [Aspergillus wentii DTO 134E9]|uniref:Uncharacterized protein n=1 Tax=Aspergillus wentii DTO 134E9 TaxID=1073089 RepID=A0A1L9RZW6_ASPWE|nr:uncharacterized protein ASPWEDRAFT_166549 [Aspergillus wentii DTO 134E9]KAI9932898.1 hypothetical protein MW887_009150 [Aspergillus wentii]OJJ40481.1 hypothetical protein ASPWEDRAFT_166549 [Aspergillus wentii DTO 134E9]